MDGPSIGGPDGFAPPVQDNHQAPIYEVQTNSNNNNNNSLKPPSQSSSNAASAYPGKYSAGDLKRWVHFIIKDRSSRDKLAHVNRFVHALQTPINLPFVTENEYGRRLTTYWKTFTDYYHPPPAPTNVS